MKEHIVQYGQSIFDIAVNIYGDISGVWDIIDDNSLTEGLDSDLEGGQVLMIREGETFTANTITEYFNRYPAFINNSDYEDFGVIVAFSLILREIGNENNGNDGYVIIDIVGGKADYSFQWVNVDTGAIVSTSQNLVAAPAGTYSVTSVDADSNEATLTNLVISVVDNTVYLVDDFGNIVSDDEGNLIIVN